MAGRNDLPTGLKSRQPGIVDSFQIAVRAVTEYVMVRFELAGFESKEALQKVVKILIALVLALMCLAAGFLYLSLSLVYVLAVKAAWGWGWALAGSGLAMLIVTGISLVLAKMVVQGLWFPVTTAEIKKDIEWLKPTPHV